MNVSITSSTPKLQYSKTPPEWPALNLVAAMPLWELIEPIAERTMFG